MANASLRVPLRRLRASGGTHALNPQRLQPALREVRAMDADGLLTGGGGLYWQRLGKERYNQFAVIEGTTFTLLNGEYEYKVYAQTSAVNTNPDLANELVETGILKCQLVEQPEVFYSPA